MPSLLRYFKPTNLNNFVIIIPCVSVGNVPQLAVDLLIKTYNLEKVASVWHSSIVPTVGADPYNCSSSEICTACELYSNEDLKIACLQLRSTIETKTARKFFEDVYNSLKEMKVKKVVILSSAFDYELHNIKKERFYFLGKSQLNLTNIPNIKELEKSDNNKYSVNGAGFSINLYSVLSKTLDCLLLGKYISEGDNRPDAQSLLEKVLNVTDLQQISKNVEYPSSWDYVFGAPPPIGIY
ncbi:proteasome assembly chaperone 2 [Diabrotica undecimpunctata]|uniref:proteasome assembly chaperone 2 n=1 Tax=Diabrotica undecimpunctata TaxID=50387 RepID=UPI003B63CCFA